ncbi:MAG: DNA lyase [Acidobacteria bacterium]|nr:DNA lyase [Acidobacteriota bacterium]
MRLWSLHPSLLDRAGLLALWREALLERFRNAERPVAAIVTYLWGVYREAGERGYHFDASKIAGATSSVSLQVTRGQLAYEAGHLGRKLLRRDPARLERLRTRGGLRPHPMFVVIRGGIEP